MEHMKNQLQMEHEAELTAQQQQHDDTLRAAEMEQNKRQEQIQELQAELEVQVISFVSVKIQKEIGLQKKNEVLFGPDVHHESDQTASDTPGC